VELKAAYQQLLKSIESLEYRQREVNRALLGSDEIITQPRIYLRGQFKEYLQERRCIRVRIEGSNYFYPISNYRSEYLPFPGHQVLIFKEYDGLAVYGFGQGGRQIPIAPQVSLVLRSISGHSGMCQLSDEQGSHGLALTVESFQGMDCRVGNTYTFRVIQALPHKVYVLDAEKPNSVNTQQISNIVFSQFNS
jgi:hypothetical protein